MRGECQKQTVSAGNESVSLETGKACSFPGDDYMFVSKSGRGRVDATALKAEFVQTCEA